MVAILAFWPVNRERESARAPQGPELDATRAAVLEVTAAETSLEAVLDGPKSLPRRVAIRDLVRFARSSISPDDVSRFYADKRAIFGSRTEQEVASDIKEILAYRRAREILAADGVDAWDDAEP